jgi:hypothetical protein
MLGLRFLSTWLPLPRTWAAPGGGWRPILFCLPAGASGPLREGDYPAGLVATDFEREPITDKQRERRHEFMSNVEELPVQEREP